MIPPSTASQYDVVAMPETLRQEFSIATPPGGQAMRGTLHMPGGNNGVRRPAVVLHRGLPSADEAGGDLIEAVAVACADAGFMALQFEPRVADLLLNDFNAYTIADEADDVVAAVNTIAGRADVDPARLGLLGFGLGAIAAAIAGRRLDSIKRLSLIAPATGGYVVSRLLKGNGAPAPLQPQQLPQAWAATLVESDAPGDVAAADRPTLIVHGAADRFIAPAASLAYLTALEAARRFVERMLIARADHAFSSPVGRRAAVERLVRFLTEPALARPSRAIGAAKA